jgi:hypothetical protein
MGTLLLGIPFSGWVYFVKTIYPKRLDLSISLRIVSDNQKEKALDCSRAFDLYRTLPDFSMAEG